MAEMDDFISDAPSGHFACCPHCACDPKEPRPVHSYMCAYGCNDDD